MEPTAAIGEVATEVATPKVQQPNFVIRVNVIISNGVFW